MFLRPIGCSETQESRRQLLLFVGNLPATSCRLTGDISLALVVPSFTMTVNYHGIAKSDGIEPIGMKNEKLRKRFSIIVAVCVN